LPINLTAPNYRFMAINTIRGANLYNDEVQLNLLDEIALNTPDTIDQRQNPPTIISIDISDPVRAFNFHELYRKKYIETYYHEVTTPFPSHEMIKQQFEYNHNYKPELNVQGLTHEGHEFRYRLGLEIENRQLKQEQLNRDRIRFRYDTLAVILSAVAILLSIISLMLR